MMQHPARHELLFWLTAMFMVVAWACRCVRVIEDTNLNLRLVHSYCQDYDPENSATHQGRNLKQISMAELYKAFGLDEQTQVCGRRPVLLTPQSPGSGFGLCECAKSSASCRLHLRCLIVWVFQD